MDFAEKMMLAKLILELFAAMPDLAAEIESEIEAFKAAPNGLAKAQTALNTAASVASTMANAIGTGNK